MINKFVKFLTVNVNMCGYACLLISVYIMNKTIASERINTSSFSSFITQRAYFFYFNDFFDFIVAVTATLKFNEI